jgi:hypothetical protein
VQIDIEYDSSVSSAPAAFETDINIAVEYLESLFTNPVTITIDVGYGEIDGQPLGSNDLGESEASQYVIESYSAVRNALIAEDAPGSSTLPTTSPFSGSLAISQAEAKALGLPQNNLGIDGYVGFSSTSGIFSYANNTAPPSNEYYFIGVVEHEITEDMGRVSLLNYQPDDYAPIDLYRYSSPGVRDLTTGGSGSTAYFSIDNGDTNLGSWNNNPSNGDLADWYGSNIPNNGYDAFDDYSNPGVVNIFSQSDITLMEALGWTVAEADFDADLVWSNPNGMVATWTLDGSQVTTEADISYQGAPVVLGSSWSIAALGDYEGAADSNILWRNTNGSLLAWTMNGSVVTSIQSLTYQGAPAGPDSSWSIAGIGAFTNNGNYDIVWRGSNGVLIDWNVNGSTVESLQAITYQGAATQVDSSWSVGGIANFSGNGNADVIWRNTNGALIDWSMNGSQIMSISAFMYQGAPVDLPNSWNIAGIGEYAGNGTDDILWQNANGTLLEWDMNGLQIGSIQSITYQGTPVDLGSVWTIDDIGNFSGSTYDIVLSNNSTGVVVDWIMNGATITSIQVLTYLGNLASASSLTSETAPNPTINGLASSRLFQATSELGAGPSSGMAAFSAPTGDQDMINSQTANGNDGALMALATPTFATPFGGGGVADFINHSGNDGFFGSPLPNLGETSANWLTESIQSGWAPPSFAMQTSALFNGEDNANVSAPASALLTGSTIPPTQPTDQGIDSLTALTAPDSNKFAALPPLVGQEPQSAGISLFTVPNNHLT